MSSKRKHVLTEEDQRILDEISAIARASESKQVARKEAYVTKYDTPRQGAVLQYWNYEHEFGPSARNWVVLSTLNPIAAGTAHHQRSKREILVASVQLRYVVRTNDAGTVADRHRFILGIDKNPDGAAVTPTDVLSTDDIDSFRNIEDKERFKIILDETFDMNIFNNSATTGVTQIFKDKEFYKWFKKSIPISFTNVTGALAEIRNNNFFAMAASQVTTNASIGKLYTRFRFTCP